MNKIALYFAVVCVLCTIVFLFGSLTKRKNSIQSRAESNSILNGKQIGKNDYPYKVFIYIKDPRAPKIGNGCTGVLLDPYWVITAAHCIDSIQSNEGIFVLVNSIDAINDSSRNPDIAYRVIRYFTHPYYILNHNPDLALLRLERAASASVYPKLANQEYYYTKGREVDVIGYGYNYAFPSPSVIVTPSKTTQKGIVFSFDKYIFTGIPSKLSVPIFNPNLPGNMFSVGHDYSGNNLSGFCEGDSGGPVIYINREGKTLTETHVLLGIMTNAGCAYINDLALAPRIYMWREWVQCVISNYPRDRGENRTLQDHCL